MGTLALAQEVNLRREDHNRLQPQKVLFMYVVAARAWLRSTAPTFRFCKARTACTTARLAFLLLAFLWGEKPAPEPVSSCSPAHY